MNTITIILVFLASIIYYVTCEKPRMSYPKRKSKTTTTTTSTEIPIEIPNIYRAPNLVKVPEKIDIPVKKKSSLKMLPPELLQEWARDISNELLSVERQVVRRDVLRKHFSDIKIETRDGGAIVENAAAKLEEFLERRVKAAQAIGREAEKLAAYKRNLPTDYIFDSSIDLDKLKPYPGKPEEYEIPLNCSSLRRVPLKSLPHFGKMSKVELDISSVKVASEVFDCDTRVLKHVHWTEHLLDVFQQNYVKDAMMDFQYFCSAKGFMRHYPAASWDSMFSLQLNEDDEGPADVYDCRLRPWYVAASGAPRDILILFDGSGSMLNTSNKINAEQFILTLLTALTDDDQFNVVRFNIEVEYAVRCFENMFVSANHVNTAAVMAASVDYDMRNITNITLILTEGVKMLQREQQRTNKPKSCQQALILISDTIPENYTKIVRALDPSGSIRLFVIWLHDVNGLRDASREYGESLSCPSDGHYAELVTASDVTEQAMQVLRVLERPLVHQRKERLTVFSDLYAHVEDPRRSEYCWVTKENAEQNHLYTQLRKNKEKFIADLPQYIEEQELYDQNGYYYEGVDLDFRLQISVSVPVFDDTRLENITIQLAEEKQRNATRTYPVNRLLGVVGVDIPIEHLKMILPYHQLGAGGALFIIDHRGSIILHDNLKPTFDGNILKPGYRTADMIELEQPAVEHTPRNYPAEWIKFRNEMVVEKPRGKRVMSSKYIFENGMRAFLESREYHWKRVQNHYTVVVSLPVYNRRHAVPDGAFTQHLAAKTVQVLNNTNKDFSIQPDWLYCKHIHHQDFEDYEAEVQHFLQRRMEEPNFKMQNLDFLNMGRFAHIDLSLLKKTHICNEELMARLCKEMIAIEQWAEEHQDEDEGRDCVACLLGSVTAFFASESGLTRWQPYVLTSSYADPPSGREWPRGPAEDWYKRAAAAPNTLVVHAPVTPIRKMRNTFLDPPKLEKRDIWLTAARTLELEKGMLGVAGFHFHPKHINDVLESTTNKPCPDETECEPQCDGVHWSCVLIDEGGWVVAGDWQEPSCPEATEAPPCPVQSAEGPAREHLARLYPAAMRALLDANIFKLHWIHDYQAVCFPPKPSSAFQMLPAFFKSMWLTLSVLLRETKEMVILLSLLSSGGLIAGDTAFELEKRRNSTRRSYEREKWERLYDERAVVNRTLFAACDRSRPVYVLQRTPKALELLRRRPNNSTWPLVGVAVPETNLILLAICNVCSSPGKPVPDPMANIKVNMSSEQWGPQPEPAQLACWRNLAPLAARPRNATCYPHVYEDEEGYRQCGPWLPDPEVEEENSGATAKEFNKLILLPTFYFHILHFWT